MENHQALRDSSAPCLSRAATLPKATKLELGRGAHLKTPSSANHTATASQPTGRIAKAASWLHLSRVSPALLLPERPSHTHTPKPGFGGRGHENCGPGRKILAAAAADLVWVCAPPRTISKWLRRLAFWILRTRAQDPCSCCLIFRTKVDEKVDISGWRIKIVAKCGYTHQIVGQKWVPDGALLSRGRVWPVDVPETSCKSMPTL